ncbi:MAG TPA: hypothetical protein ENK43_04685 [Planctomycetes bacterium]|nr:hypothetical protein [Planctomycetota bacterium]
MTFEYVCWLKTEKEKPGTDGFPALTSGFVDWAARGAMARGDGKHNKYRKFVSRVDKISPDAFRHLEIDPKALRPGWCVIQVEFELQRPWFSKDDRYFHPLHNPLRKDRVFGVPYMSAASWKGLLRWACRMEAGLLEHLERNGGRLDGWRDQCWITHLFGNAKGEAEEFVRGALLCHPTWFDRIGFEVINPHSRKTRAGTVPITYEVVPERTKGKLSLLYAPLPPSPPDSDAISKLLASIEKLMKIYGFSAKRTAGWGMARICKWRLVSFSQEVEEDTQDRINLEELIRE